jgi:hypothetical protein
MDPLRMMEPSSDDLTRRKKMAKVQLFNTYTFAGGALQKRQKAEVCDF